MHRNENHSNKPIIYKDLNKERFTTFTASIRKNIDQLVNQRIPSDVLATIYGFYNNFETHALFEIKDALIQFYNDYHQISRTKYDIMNSFPIAINLLCDHPKYGIKEKLLALIILVNTYLDGLNEVFSSPIDPEERIFKKNLSDFMRENCLILDVNKKNPDEKIQSFLNLTVNMKGQIECSQFNSTACGGNYINEVLKNFTEEVIPKHLQVTTFAQAMNACKEPLEKLLESWWIKNHSTNDSKPTTVMNRI
jgi:hypothetical protein